MNMLAVIFALAVGIINIMLNIKVQDAARTGGNTFLETLLSVKFLIAFGIGTISITLLLLFYYNANKFNLAQSLILMGSMSIIIGTFYGWYYRGNQISPIELLVLFTMIGSYTYKYISTT